MFLTAKTPSTRRKTKKERKLSVLCAFAVHFVASTDNNTQRGGHPFVALQVIPEMGKLFNSRSLSL
jgi:hypothetical protein